MPPSDVVLGRYCLLRRLDDCDVGDAYLAKRIGIEGFEKRVVIWRVGGALTHDTGLVHAVMLEAKQCASLSHANIAQVLDLGVVDGTCVVVSEHAPGRTLDMVLRMASELRWPVAVHLAREVAEALAYAHQRRGASGELLRLVHRRLSPGRIVLSSAGDVKLMGFGTSFAWTPLDEYRPPEEARAEPVDGRADVFALGAILARCLPRAGVPEALRHLVDHTMHPYPEHRPTAAELQEELTQVLHTAGLPVTPRDIAALTVATAPHRPCRLRGSLTDSLLQTARELEARGALPAAIERLEQALDSMAQDPSTTPETMLAAYERLQRLCADWLERAAAFRN